MPQFLTGVTRTKNGVNKNFKINQVMHKHLLNILINSRIKLFYWFAATLSKKFHFF